MCQLMINLFETKCHDNTMHSTLPFHCVSYDSGWNPALGVSKFPVGRNSEHVPSWK